MNMVGAKSLWQLHKVFVRLQLCLSNVDVLYERSRDKAASQSTLSNLHASASDKHSVCNALLCAPVELLWHCKTP